MIIYPYERKIGNNSYNISDEEEQKTKIEEN
jgi:hypothetical protein